METAGPDITQWIVGQVGLGGVAALALFLFNYVYAAALRREREYAEENREDKKLLIAVVSKNSEIMAELRSIIQESIRDRSNASSRT